MPYQYTIEITYEVPGQPSKGGYLAVVTFDKKQNIGSLRAWSVGHIQELLDQVNIISPGRERNWVEARATGTEIIRADFIP